MVSACKNRAVDFSLFILEEDWLNIRIINKLHLLKQQMLEVYHMEKQILLDKPVSHLGEADKSLGGGRWN